MSRAKKIWEKAYGDSSDSGDIPEGDGDRRRSGGGGERGEGGEDGGSGQGGGQGSGGCGSYDSEGSKPGAKPGMCP